MGGSSEPGFDPPCMTIAGHTLDRRALRAGIEAMQNGAGVSYFEAWDVARALRPVCERRSLNASYVAGRLLQAARKGGYIRHIGRGRWVRCDSDGSPKGGDACGSVHDGAGPEGIAPENPS